MKCGCKPKGFKSYSQGKVVASEDLHHRLAKPTITGGDLYQRMQNRYGKKDNASPSPMTMPFGPGFM